MRGFLRETERESEGLGFFYRETALERERESQQLYLSWRERKLATILATIPVSERKKASNYTCNYTCLREKGRERESECCHSSFGKRERESECCLRGAERVLTAHQLKGDAGVAGEGLREVKV